MLVEGSEAASSPQPPDDHEFAADATSFVPDEIAAFRAQFGMPSNFTVTLRKRLPSGSMGICAPFLRVGTGKLSELTMLDIGQQYGPGDYTLSFTWLVRGGPEGDRRQKQHKSEEMHFTLEEAQWRPVHDKWKREQQRADLEERITHQKRMAEAAEAAKLDAQLAAAPEGKKSGLDEIKAAMDLVRTVQGTLGVGGGKSGLDLEGILKIATVVVPLMKELFGGRDKSDDLIKVMLSSQEQSNKMIMALLMKEGGGGQMGLLEKAFNTGMNIVSQAAGAARQLGAPEPEESTLDKILGVVDRMGPFILQMATKTAAQRQADPLYRMAANSEPVRALKQDPALQKDLVQALDERYGFQQTEDILKALSEIGIKRPPELAGNFKDFPSDGYGPDGLPFGSDPAASEAVS